MKLTVSLIMTTLNFVGKIPDFFFFYIKPEVVLQSEKGHFTPNVESSSGDGLLKKLNFVTYRLC